MIGRAVSQSVNQNSITYILKEEKKPLILGQGNLFGRTPKDIFQELKIVDDMNTRSKRGMLDVLISFDKTQKVTLQQQKEIVEEVINKLEAKDHQWVAVKHQNTDEQHIHIKIGRHDFSGKLKLNDSRIGERVGKIANNLAKKHGLETASEIAQKRRQLIKTTLHRIIPTVMSWEDLKEKMDNEDYIMVLASSDEKGVYGARIIPKEAWKSDDELSKKEKFSKKGYKLSSITRNIKIKNIQMVIDKNQELIRNQKNQKSKKL